MAILMRRLSSEGAFGVMMSLDPSEGVGCLIRFLFATRDCWRSVLRVPLSRRSHWRGMMSVVIDRDYLCTFFDRLGRCFVCCSLGDAPCLLMRLYSWTLSVAFFIQGWLAAPLTYLLPWSVFRLVRRDSNPGWGDWRRSFWFGYGFVLWFVLVHGQF